jgi:hypothetical protein
MRRAPLFAIVLTGCSGTVETATVSSSSGEPPPAPCVPGERWTHLPNPPGPDADMPNLAWGGSQLFDWSGQAVSSTLPTDWLRSGALFNPATSSWTPVPTAGAPVGRISAGAVWANDRFVVWGGVTPAPVGSSNSGGVYDPASQSWSTMTTTGAPSPRVGFSAISAGSTLIVWGGARLGLYPLATGGIYDPMSDTWTAVAEEGAPSARAGHLAVWTGKQMIIWGGSSGPTGGLYDPVLKTWRAMSPENAPDWYQQTAIWTGSTMIVWGGIPVDGATEPGGIYDPASDQWAPISDVGAPSGAAVAVWAGMRMIAFVRGANQVGGSYALYAGIYDPATNRWAPVTTEGAPTDFGPGIAAWDGCQVILAGDTTAGTAFWAYQPQP